MAVETFEWFIWAWIQSPAPPIVLVLENMGAVEEPWDRKWSNMGVFDGPSTHLQFGCACKSWSHPRTLKHRVVIVGNGDFKARIAVATCPACRVIYWCEVPLG